MRRATVLLLIIIGLAFCNASFAQKVLYQDDAGVSLTIPANWTYETADGSISTFSPDEEVAILFFPVAADDLESSLEELDDIIMQEYPNFEAGEAETTDLNGMSTVFVDGYANDGSGVNISAAIIMAPYQHLIMLVFASESGMDRYMEDVGNLMMSIVEY